MPDGVDREPRRDLREYPCPACVTIELGRLRKPVGAPMPVDTAVQGVAGVAFSPDGKLLASADRDGTVRLWRVSPFSDPYTALCADVGPPTKYDWTRYAPGEPQRSVCG